jgi:hypothetical protein
MRRITPLKKMGLAHQEEEKMKKIDKEEEMKENKGKEEVNLPTLHLRIPLLGQ